MYPLLRHDVSLLCFIDLQGLKLAGKDSRNTVLWSSGLGGRYSAPFYALRQYRSGLTDARRFDIESYSKYLYRSRASMLVERLKADFVN